MAAGVATLATRLKRWWRDVRQNDLVEELTKRHYNFGDLKKAIRDALAACTFFEDSRMLRLRVIATEMVFSKTGWEHECAYECMLQPGHGWTAADMLALLSPAGEAMEVVPFPGGGSRPLPVQVMSGACVAAFSYGMVRQYNRDTDLLGYGVEVDFVVVARACVDLHDILRTCSLYGRQHCQIPFALMCATRIMWPWVRMRRAGDVHSLSCALRILLRSQMWTDFGECLPLLRYPTFYDMICTELVQVFDLRDAFVAWWKDQDLPFEDESRCLDILRDAFAVACAHLDVYWGGFVANDPPVQDRRHCLQQFGAAMETHAAEVRVWSAVRRVWIGAVMRIVHVHNSRKGVMECMA